MIVEIKSLPEHRTAYYMLKRAKEQLYHQALCTFAEDSRLEYLGGLVGCMDLWQYFDYYRTDEAVSANINILKTGVRLPPSKSSFAHRGFSDDRYLPSEALFDLIPMDIRNDEEQLVSYHFSLQDKNGTSSKAFKIIGDRIKRMNADICTDASIHPDLLSRRDRSNQDSYTEFEQALEPRNHESDVIFSDMARLAAQNLLNAAAKVGKGKAVARTEEDGEADAEDGSEGDGEDESSGPEDDEDPSNDNMSLMLRNRRRQVGLQAIPEASDDGLDSTGNKTDDELIGITAGLSISPSAMPASEYEQGDSADDATRTSRYVFDLSSTYPSRSLTVLSYIIQLSDDSEADAEVPAGADRYVFTT
ncbi:hypothetical protein EUX98_g1396 [Antrodiella citrinella]|uniref:Uncharacterized protein n=1 Tax=Antrodiella citrinella TaxID=2447956 RepID=A0A4S4N4M1_9APHY|nr:hypothetical protein EUX98_g1396 [Antrodiella citrinella]